MGIKDIVNEEVTAGKTCGAAMAEAAIRVRGENGIGMRTVMAIGKQAGDILEASMHEVNPKTENVTSVIEATGRLIVRGTVALSTYTTKLNQKP